MEPHTVYITLSLSLFLGVNFICQHLRQQPPWVNHLTMPHLVLAVPMTR